MAAGQLFLTFPLNFKCQLTTIMSGTLYIVVHLRCRIITGQRQSMTICGVISRDLPIAYGKNRIYLYVGNISNNCTAVLGL